ncbi:MAG: ligase-associated DNA damage response endonuclease PdeM [Flammeovirgaceae bacterium]|nr:ligase-associated DNA damage response endonuclease PdeM [Flammeovirgaceae bacterium]
MKNNEETKYGFPESYECYNIHNQQLILFPEKCIFWKEEKTLILADLHLGKAGHFRKAGIPIPSQLHLEELVNLSKLVMDLAPKKLLILGDLFHSEVNNEWEYFNSFIQTFPELEVILVLGNHDTYALEFIPNRVKVFTETLVIGKFIFSHIPLNSDQFPNNLYNLCGHIHPSAKLIGNGRQILNLPCFFFSEKMGILPAYGFFTGKHTIQPTFKDSVFVIAEGKVMKA